MHPSDSFSLDSRDTTIPVGIRFPGMGDGTQPAGQARDGNDAI